MNKHESWQSLRFRNYIYSLSAVIFETNTNETDMWGCPVGIEVRATRFDQFAVIMVDVRGDGDEDTVDDYPEYTHLSSIDKVMEDAADIYFQYGFDGDPSVYISEGSKLVDHKKEVIDFANRSVVLRGTLKQADLPRVINEHVLNVSKLDIEQS